MSLRNLGFIPDIHVQPHLEAHLKALSYIRSNIDSDLLFIPELFLPFSIENYNSISILHKRVSSGEYLNGGYVGLLSGLRQNWQLYMPQESIFKEAVDFGISIAIHTRGPEQPVVIDNTNFAYAPLFDMALTRKCSKENISSNPSLLEHYRVMLAAYIACYKLMADFLRSNQHKYCSVTGYNDYGPMSAARRAADVNSLQYTMLTNSIVSGFDKNRLIVYNNPEICHKRKKHELYSQIANSWHMYTHADILEFGEREITSKLSGKSLQCYSPVAYMSKSDELDNLIESIDRNKTLLTLYVSSNDEANAIQDWLSFYGIYENKSNNRYSSQFDWLEDWLNNADRLNIQFILRMHPRIGKDHRGHSRCVDYDEWLRIGNKFQRKGHITVHPESDVSSYILPYLAAHNITSWSSIGQDLALLGFSVSQAFSQPGGILNFPRDSNFLPYTAYIEELATEFCHKDSKDILNTIGAAAVFYAWFRGLSSYTLDNNKIYSGTEFLMLARELAEMITSDKILPEENHFNRLQSSFLLSESNKISDAYPRLRGYVKIMLRHALEINTIIERHSYLSNESRDFISQKINQRMDQLSEVVGLLEPSYL